MNYKYSALILLFWTCLLHGQSLDDSNSKIDQLRKGKPVIDDNAIKEKIRLGETCLVSSDGEYFVYNILNQPLGSNTVIVRSMLGKWEKKLPGINTVGFSGDQKDFLYTKGDTLFFQSLGNDNCSKLPIVNYKKSSTNTVKWLAFQSPFTENRLIVLNLINRTELYIDNVRDYSFSENGKLLVCKRVVKADDQSLSSFSCVDLERETVIPIWSGRESEDIGGVAFDKLNKQIVFAVIKRRHNQVHKEVWHFRVGEKVGKLLIGNDDIIKGYSMDESLEFSADGGFVLLRFRANLPIKPIGEYVNVNVWSYTDTLLQSTQLKEPLGNDLRKRIRAAVKIENSNVVLLDKEFGEAATSFPVDKGEYAVVSYNAKGDRFWINDSAKSWLVSMQDGNKKVIPTKGACRFWFSPSGDYLLFYDAGQGGHYFCYAFKSNLVTKLTNGFRDHKFTYINEAEYPVGKSPYYPAPTYDPTPVGLAAWIDGGSKILIYDNYDIWLFDIQGIQKPINLTNGFGQGNKIKFRLTTKSQNPLEGISYSDTLLLSGFNMVNKENGFYYKKVDSGSNPVLLTMGPYTYFHSILNVESSSHQCISMEPVKAHDVNLWVVKRESAIDAPNFFYTRDFKSFIPLTDLQPQKKYNWLQRDLLTWKQPNGIVNQGILYKPENFDASKKYPIIIYLYTQFSHRLNEHFQYDYTNDGHINIPWFVSQGYVVFTPDIHFTLGKIGESGYNSVMSGVEYLSRFSFIDKSKMAISSHSYGGQIAYYILTHTNVFAAGLVGAGTSNQISSALQLAGGLKKGGSRLGSAEMRFGTSIWKNIDAYSKESAVLSADKLTSPLLIFHCKDDGALPWEQGVEMFLASRRLKKKVWMLEYEGARHNVSGNDAVDFTIRVNSFFNHYLKEEPAQIWMTRGIRASSKGIITGYDLDPAGNCGKDCKVCKSWNEKVKNDPSILTKITLN